jgi:hypothetical protein
VEKSRILEVLADAYVLQILTGHHHDFVSRWCTDNEVEFLSYSQPQIVVDHCIDRAIEFLFDFGENLCRQPDQRWQLVQDGPGEFMLIVYSVERECPNRRDLRVPPTRSFLTDSGLIQLVELSVFVAHSRRMS